MIRWSFIFLALLAMLAVGMRDWFKAFCGILLFSVLQEHHYFRYPLADISGLRVINLLLPVVVWQWWMQRKIEGLRWDAPPFLRLTCLAYILILLYGVAICLPDFNILASQGWTVGTFGYDELVVPSIPFVLALLLYDGARSRQRVVLAMLTLAAMASIAGAYIVKIIPVGSLLDPDSVLLYRLRIDKLLGLHPNDVVSILVPGMWIAAGCILLIERTLVRLVLAGSILGMGLALLLTQSRTGMVALLAVSLMLGLMRFRKVVLIVGVLGVATFFALPSISANWSRGMSVYAGEGQVTADLSTITSGRTELWQYAWRDICEAPLMGHGIRWWSRSWPAGEEAAGSHPHNAYLEIWMHYGLFGLLVIVTVFVTLLVPCIRLMKKGLSRLELVVGLGGTACVLTQLVVALSTRALLPRPSAIISFCMCALAMRVYVLSRSAVAARSAPRAALRPGAAHFVRLPAGARLPYQSG